MASIHSEDDDRSTVYALLTKWTQGESAGGQRQNFFRLLAEDACPSPEEADAAGVGSEETTQVFVKLHEPGRGLRVQAFVTHSWRQPFPGTNTSSSSPRLCRPVARRL